MEYNPISKANIQNNVQTKYLSRIGSRESKELGISSTTIIPSMLNIGLFVEHALNDQLYNARSIEQYPEQWTVPSNIYLKVSF